MNIIIFCYLFFTNFSNCKIPDLLFINRFLDHYLSFNFSFDLIFSFPFFIIKFIIFAKRNN